jgi:hypothetical protein
MKNLRYCLPISTKYGISRHIFVDVPNIKFSRKYVQESRADTCEQIGRRTGRGADDKPNNRFLLFMQTRFLPFVIAFQYYSLYVRLLILTGYIHYVSSYARMLRFLCRYGAFWHVWCSFHLYLSKRTITADSNLDVSRLIPSEPGVGPFFFFSYMLSHFCVTLFLLRLAYVIFRETYFRQVKPHHSLLYSISTMEAFSEPKMLRWEISVVYLCAKIKKLNGVHAVLHFTPYYSRLSTPHQHFVGYTRTSVISP